MKSNLNDYNSPSYHRDASTQRQVQNAQDLVQAQEELNWDWDYGVDQGFGIFTPSQINYFYRSYPSSMMADWSGTKD